MASSSHQRRIARDASHIQSPAPGGRDVESRRESLNSFPPNDLGAQLAQELAAAWEQERFTSVEQFFADRPQACADPEIAVRLIYEEFCLRQEAGEEVDPEEFLARFPQWRSKLEIVFDCHQVVQTAQETPAFPSVGEQFGEFRLLTELGRGAEGRVFLATQRDLSDRPVVVKVVSRRGNEHLSLARLQHTSIVPLYTAQDHEARNLRLLCMPYVGGLSLARLLETLAEVPVARRSGQHFVAALQAARAAAPVAIRLEGPALQFLPQASYLHAVCWIGACVADALQYAHGRGLAHLDLKPSNVLLAGDGQPMLLDFHLAREVVRPGCATCGWLGGTPGYMSPEQEQALAAIREGRPVPMAVDGRSDIYSLGWLLYELLGCPPTIAPRSFRVPALQEFDPSVPRELAAIVQKCLAPNPEDRYPDAGRLAGDLRRCLIDLPSGGRTDRAGAGGPKPRGKSLRPLAFVVLLLVAVATLGAGVFHRFLTGDTRDQEPAAPRAPSSVPDPLRRLRSADELHLLVDGLRFASGLDSPPADRLRKLESGCNAVWQARARLTDSSASPLAPDIERRVRTDLLDLAILWADLHVRVASGEQVTQARREALHVLAQAEAEFGRSVVLSQEQQVYAAALGLTDQARGAPHAAAPLTPHTGWEHHAVGRSLLRAGRLEQALTEFQQAIDLEPHEFWPNFYAGTCAYRLRQFERALAAFSACVALAPDRAECFYNRGLAYQALGCRGEAARDFESARRLDGLAGQGGDHARAISPGRKRGDRRMDHHR